ncbi:hypothetical protein BKA62DRAFT_264426 [Auriculariales sp. MPI-PUGE-AT-0066]|nr:hypothetical protein BKA62DRAFT_264426 [Auriculariales sp. MPI-PUGE-AT-0066]
MASRTAALVLAAASLVAAFNPAHLFPIKLTSAWTTLPKAPSGSGATVVALDYNALGVRKRMSGVQYTTVNALGDAPANSTAWPAYFPKGSYNPTGDPRGGLGFYFPGPESMGFWNDSSVTQVLFSYAVMFPANFTPNLGGKLPGPYGGATEDQAYACSGGRQEDRGGCFDLRLMWRENLQGEIYTYLPLVDGNTAALSQIQNTFVDETYGISVARGAFTFAKGNYTVVAQRVQLNTIGKSDGELELWVDGKSVLHATGLQIRTQAESVFRGVHFQTFFGGSDSSWATPIDQTIYFTGMSGGVVQNGASSSQGKAAYPLGGNAQTVTHPSLTVTATGTTRPLAASSKPSSQPNAAFTSRKTPVATAAIVVILGLLV